MLLLVGVFTKQIDSFARSSMVLWYLIGGLLLICSHMTVRAVLESMGKRGVGMKRTAIIGANRLGYDIAKNAVQSTDSGLSVVGFFDDRGCERRLETDVDLPFVGNTSDLLSMVHRNEIDHVLIALPMRAEKRIQSLLNEFGNTTEIGRAHV
jgi:FlaA1/EpsC-like NDP-sugar epimerase